MRRKRNIRRREPADITNCSSEGLPQGKCVKSCVLTVGTRAFSGTNG